MAACLSCNKHGLVGLSLDNNIIVYNISTKKTLLQYTNNKATDDKDSNDGNFVQHRFSTNGKHLAAVTGNKKLIVWNLEQQQDEEKGVAGEPHIDPIFIDLPRRPTCLNFCYQQESVLVGDKTGDVHQCKINKQQDDDNNEPPKLLLGHLSMVLDLTITPDDGFIISADRDEKIRVSHFPNSYNIFCYLFGHNRLVSCVKLMNNNLLLSGSGDKMLRLWDITKGNEVSCFNINEIDENIKVISKIVNFEDMFVVIGEGSKLIHIFHVNNSVIKHDSSLTMEEDIHDVCFHHNGDLLILIKHSVHNVVIIKKESLGVTSSSSSSSTSSSHHYFSMGGDVFNTCNLLPRKVYTDLLKPESKMRKDILITPDATFTFDEQPDNQVAMAT